MPRKPTPSHRFRQSDQHGYNWKDGRSVASNGYILIWVGNDHPLADCRGYAYEHRVVASQKIGRTLLPSEQVHHINRDKADNRPENLEVMASLAEHRLRHRTKDFDRQFPGEDNTEVACACGCGTTFPKFDSTGRPRTFASGHNPQASPAADEILSLLQMGGPLSNAEISQRLGKSRASVATSLCKMFARDLVTKVRIGVWKAKENPNG